MSGPANRARRSSDNNRLVLCYFVNNNTARAHHLGVVHVDFRQIVDFQKILAGDKGIAIRIFKNDPVLEQALTVPDLRHYTAQQPGLTKLRLDVRGENLVLP